MSLHPDSDALSGGEVQSIMNGNWASPGQAGWSHLALMVGIFRAGLPLRCGPWLSDWVPFAGIDSGPPADV